ncbi:MAG: MaoC domain protein dehydratase [Solirubrobacterales bacterium]|nr:MaoC domain protein dehydratase [Solirubrobacterales bacterium]
MTNMTCNWQAPFEQLSPGDAFTSRARTITESDVVQFAALTGDFHPLHTDAVFAAAGPFGERIAHGMLTISYAVGLVPLDPRRVLALRRITDVVFKRPVRLGDTIHVEGTITGLSPLTEQAGLVTFSWRIRDAADRLLTRASIEVLWATDAPAEAQEEPEPASKSTGEHAVFGQELHPAGSFVPVPL